MPCEVEKMALRWIPLDREKYSSIALLEFRNRVSGINSAPEDAEIKALESLLDESKTLYNLISVGGNRIVAWASGKFFPQRQTDMVRTFFFDLQTLGEQGVDDLLYHLETALPFPYRRIEIYGLGAGRERDMAVVKASGYRKSFDIAHFQRIMGVNNPSIIDFPSVNFIHDFDFDAAFEIYKNAFEESWDLDQIDLESYQRIISGSDHRYTFICEKDGKNAGIVIVNKGLVDYDAYLQIIGVVKESRKDRIGDAMMQYLVSLLEENCIKTISLSTYAKNRSMRNLLRRWKFVEQFRETILFKEDFRPPNDYVPDMRKVD
jgi:ribosomal protein S18 acetylase RimI-like enzyme